MNKEKTVERLLIVKLSAIGDVVHALPCLPYLRARFPELYIGWVVEEKAREILDGNRYIDELIVINTNKWRKEFFTLKGFKKTVSEIFKSFNRVRAFNADAALDIQGLTKSGVIALLSNAKIRIGFHPENCRERANTWFMTNNSRRVKKNIHIVEKNLVPLEYFGIFQKEGKKEFSIGIREKLVHKAFCFLKKQGVTQHMLVIGINPGAGWETKLWDRKKYAQLADRLSESFFCKILLLWGSDKEKDMVQSILKLCKSKPIIPYKTSIKEFCALISHCAVLIGADTGPVHIADALGVMTVSLFGASSPDRNRPYNNGVTISGQCDLFGCYKRRCNDFVCMSSISVSTVYEKAGSLLKAFQCKNDGPYSKNHTQLSALKTKVGMY